MSDLYNADDVTAAIAALPKDSIEMTNHWQSWVAKTVLEAVAPLIAARAREALLNGAVAFVREYEYQWGNEPYWYEVARHLARADAVEQPRPLDDCPHADQEHAVWWWVDDGDPIPVPRTAQRDNHADAVAFAYSGIDQGHPALAWVKAFRSGNETYTCFQWDRADAVEQPQEGT